MSATEGQQATRSGPLFRTITLVSSAIGPPSIHYTLG